jgi:hypothetical protein
MEFASNVAKRLEYVRLAAAFSETAEAISTQSIRFARTKAATLLPLPFALFQRLRLQSVSRHETCRLARQ